VAASLRPHLVLNGLLRAAEAIAADRAYVFIADAGAAESVAGAIDELGSPTVRPDRASRCFTVAPAYIACGENSGNSCGRRRPGAAARQASPTVRERNRRAPDAGRGR
jgi:hypothetical protein